MSSVAGHALAPLANHGWTDSRGSVVYPISAEQDLNPVHFEIVGFLLAGDFAVPIWWCSLEQGFFRSVLRVEHRRWDQTMVDLRHLALTAAHPRSRERFLALHEIAPGSCATAVAERTGRRAQTVTGWLHVYNEHGPEALKYQRTGGRPPLPRYRRRTWRPGPCRATPSSQSASRRSRGKATLDAAASGRFRAGAVWPPPLPRDHPPRAAPAQAILEEGPQIARPCQA